MFPHCFRNLMIAKGREMDENSLAARTVEIKEIRLSADSHHASPLIHNS
jgi:hypothetical protein